MNVVFNKPLNPEPLPDDRVFGNSGVGEDYGSPETDASNPEQYTFLIRVIDTKYWA